MYFAVGDNGDGTNAQRLDNPHGKVLRINKDGTIPADNPFAGQPGKLGAIWAYGMRNPWRFQFDSGSGRLYVGDVGDFSWEELNLVAKGGNYGWPLAEGNCTSNCSGLIDPVYTYSHSGESAAITMGPVYHGSMFPADYQGSILFGDYARGFIKRATLDANGAVTGVQDFDTQAGAVVDLKVAPDGSLYYITYYPGALYHITYNTQSHTPTAAAAADVTDGLDPLTVHFSSTGSGDPDGDPLGFLWDFGDGTTSTEPNPTKIYPNKGVYTARLTVSAGTDHIPARPIVIQVGTPPTLTVAAPTEGQLYRAGDTITYNAFATDAAGFDVNDANIKTTIRLHHGTHFHPFAGPLLGRSGSFTIPTTGEASADTSYEVTFAATDETGVTATKVVTVRPRTVNLTFATSPPNVGITLDGVPTATPYTVPGVSGFERGLAAAPLATAPDGQSLQFAGWSDGKQVRHTIVTPDTDTTFTALYQPAQPFTAQYFANPDLSGTPVLTRQDPKIDFVWGDGSPDPAVPPDRFSARWTTTRAFGAGRYTFTTITDDGVRLYIDNKLVIDQFTGQPGTPHSYTTDLGTGNHTIKMEYFEGSGAAIASLSWESSLDQPTDAFRAEYWNTPPSSGAPVIPSTTPVISRNEDVIDHDWGDGSPGPGIGTNMFLARWTRTLNLAPGVYEFATTTDDGVRLYLDGVRVIDKWIDQGSTTYTVTQPMDGGPHTLVMEYYESGAGAVAKLRYNQVGDLPAETGYQGEYWNNPDGGSAPSIPTRPPDLTRTDEEVKFDWFEGSPAPEISSDNFIARWTRTDVLSAGMYRFSGASDDGIRVFVDNVPIVDKWQLQNAAFSVDKVVSTGPHVIRIEYFEAGAGARAILNYERTGDAQPEGGTWDAAYFPNRNLTGTPAVTRQDPTVDFDWADGSPAAGIPADNFSARWTKTVPLTEGNYKFSVTTDDGYACASTAPPSSISGSSKGLPPTRPSSHSAQANTRSSWSTSKQAVPQWRGCRTHRRPTRHHHPHRRRRARSRRSTSPTATSPGLPPSPARTRPSTSTGPTAHPPPASPPTTSPPDGPRPSR